jgi:hypothetical protein
MPPVFDNRIRDDERPKSRAMSLFEFYDRCSRPGHADQRRLINHWIDEIEPEAARTEISARMHTGGDIGFVSAFAEVLAHAVLVRFGFALTPHPEVPGTSNRPDFLVTSEAGDRVAYLEITTLNPSNQDVGRDAREGQLFETLNRCELPDDLRLEYSVLAFGQGSPPGRRISREVERWAVAEAQLARDGFRIERTFEIDGWHIQLALLPGFEGSPNSRRIAVWGLIDGNFVGDPGSPDDLKRALDQKGKKYGELDLPYIIAVFDRTDRVAWSSADFASNLAEILFGHEFYEEALQSGGVEPRTGRADDGWWGVPTRPRKRNVGAVLVFPDPYIWRLSEAERQPILVCHPWADCLLDPGLFPFKRLEMDERGGRIVNGVMISDILGLPNPWPPENQR